MDDTSISEAHMHKCCDICGDVGVYDAIVTCSQCKISREHLYCMSTIRYEHPETWFCGECEGSMKASSSDNHGQPQDYSVHPHNLSHDPRRNCIDREKKMQTSKVKLISTEEAIRLSSRVMLPVSPIKDYFRPHTVLRKNRSIKTRNYTGFQSMPLKSNSRPTSASEIENRIKPPTAVRQMAQSSAAQRENAATQPSSKKLKQSCEGHHILSRIGNEDEKGADIVVEKETIASATTISPLESDQPIVYSGGAVSSIKKIPVAALKSSDPVIPTPKVDNSSYIPASKASWKGRFNLLVHGAKEWEISGVIQAHPPSRVRKKVYESLTLMPEVLEFELVQRGGLWTSLFGNYTPDNRDIGLYLFPSTCRRCKNYMSLLDRIGEEDMVLRTCRGGLELLVFTSKILQIDCQKWDGTPFLWGLFRPMEFTNTGVKTGMNQCHNEGYNSKEIDMEIDMVGGQYVGRLDVAVPRIPCQLPPSPPPLPPRQCHGNGTPPPRLPMIPPGFEKMTNQIPCAPSGNHGTETFSEVPPGFEKLKKLLIKDEDKEDQRLDSVVVVAKGEVRSGCVVKVEKPDRFFM